MALVKPEEVHDPRIALLLEMLRARCTGNVFPSDVVDGNMTVWAAAHNGFHAAREVVDEWVRMKGPRFETVETLPLGAQDACT